MSGSKSGSRWLTYEKLTDTCKILSTREVGYVATNPDLVCPIEFGFVPDCGAMCQMIEHAEKKNRDEQIKEKKNRR